MTNPSPGWYPDPAPESAPGRLRYWDGGRWTEHVHDPEPAPAPAPQPVPTYPEPTTSPGPYPGAYPQYPASAQQYGVATEPARRTTPDGVPLSGWWWRVLARVLDGVILLPVYALVAIPWSPPSGTSSRTGSTR